MSTLGCSMSAHLSSLYTTNFMLGQSLNSDYDYNDFDPDELHEELRGFINDVANDLNQTDTDSLNQYYITKLSHMVYGSNMIESAGGNLDVTLKLCRDVFEGKPVDAQLNDRDAVYQALKLELINHPDVHDAILRSRREIVQHAKAAQYMITQVAILGNHLSEEIILETHRLLTYKLDTEDGTPWSEYSGKYRNWAVSAGLTPFMHERKVPSAMKDMIRSYESDIQAADKGEIDPIVLATKFCTIFVNIHPFGDGNGRVCRLVLNAILFKYSGCLVSIGMDADDRNEYLNIAAEASMMGLSDDMDDVPDEYKPKNYKKLASFTVKHAWKGMYEVRQLVKREV
ncbi:Ff.00g079310.m01.CDS01 [Fusarium sp. VM40]|nr:Ff.00g079310.m01.CDS01 [Fusarium sp. VM40]